MDCRRRKIEFKNYNSFIRNQQTQTKIKITSHQSRITTCIFTQSLKLYLVNSRRIIEEQP